MSLLLTAPAVRAQASLEQGIEQYSAGSFEASSNTLKAVVKQKPQLAEAHYFLGLALQRLGRLGEAAAAIENALALAPTLPSAHTNLGIIRYQLSHLPRAETSLRRALREDPDDGSAWLFLGLVQQGNLAHADALESFRRASGADPDLAQLAALNAGVSRLALDDIDGARADLNAAISGEDSDIASRARELLADLGKTPETPSGWTFTALVGLQFDDNVTTDALDSSTGLDDYALLVEAGVSYRWSFTGATELELGYSFSQSVYAELDEFNLQSHSANVFLGTEFLGFDPSVSYLYTRSLLGGDDFLGLHYVSPSLGYAVNERVYLSARYVYQAKKFMSDNARDADNHGIEGAGYWFFMNGAGYVRAGVRYENEDTTGPEFSYSAANYFAGLSVPLGMSPFRTRLHGQYRYYDRDYDNLTPSIGQVRSDQRHVFELKLSADLSKSIATDLIYEYSDSDSNLPSAEFQENIVTLQFRGSF